MNTAKIIHYGSLAAETGGPAYSTYLSIKGARLCGADCRIIMPPLRAGEHLIASDVPVIYADRSGFGKALKKCDADLFHIQGVWSLEGHAMAIFARRCGIPYVIALRGMLYPQALAKKAWKKRLALWLYQKRDLAEAACIQATCPEELRFYRELGFRNPVAVIPNAVELPPDLPEPEVKSGTFRIGYLGRLHPRKRVERLLYALASPEMRGMDAECRIIGADDPEYEAFLRREAGRLQLKNVTFAGFLQGEEKRAAIRSLSVLAVPSDFENFGNIVVEALREGVPVIASQGMPWQELETYDCGRWIPNDTESIKKALLEIAQLTPEYRQKMGCRGQKLLREKYEFTAVSEKMDQMYRWLLKEGAKPDFVEEIR